MSLPLNLNLKNHDPVLFNLIKLEKERQKNCIELIASENFTNKAVMECLGSVLTNKYSEGLPGKRYYGGNKYIDKIEEICKKRALEVFELDNSYWDVNVQSYSGSIANLAIQIGLLKPNQRIMGLALSHGGHLSHGHYTKNKNLTATSIFFDPIPYFLDSSGYIDYDDLEKKALYLFPKLIICGGSAYPRDINYSRIRKIADKIGSYVLCDMSHTSGLIASNLLNNPFIFSDVVMTTTHKSFGGPRSALIFCKKELINCINNSVFPCIQGGPHNHQIAGVATQLKLVSTEKFRKYSIQVIKNSKKLSDCLIKKKFDIMTNGTDNHIILINLKNNDITGSKMELVCEQVDITLNKNSIPNDKSMLSPGGIRIGTCAITTRGMTENDMEKIADFLEEVLNITIEIQQKYGKKLKNFIKAFEDNYFITKLDSIKNDVNKFSNKFSWYE